MSLFQVDRTQFPIGQGGFHATVIHMPRGKNLSMVIDCGGADKSHRNRLIKVFSEGKRQHDILAISHFDADHINGVDDLREAGIKFNTVFLPHVEVQSYLLWMTLKLSISEEAPEKLAHIVQTSGRLYGGDYGSVVLVGPPSLLTIDEHQDDLLEDSNLANVLSDDAYKAVQKARGLSGQVFSCSQSLNIREIDWLFRFYSREWTFPKEAKSIWDLEFLDSLKAVVNITKQQMNTSTWTSFSTQLITELKAKIAPSDAEKVMSLISVTPAKNDPRYERLVKLKNEIKKAKNGGLSCKYVLGQLYELSETLKDYNDASMCVYSGPAQRGTSVPREQFSRSVHLGRRALRTEPQDGVYSREVGWISTGDSDFSTQEKLRDFLWHYCTEIALTSIFVLPHHGSRMSYDPNLDLLRELSANLCERPLFIAPANPENKTYHHPHWPVESTCRKAGDFYIVDQSLASFYAESVKTVCSLPRIFIFD